MVFSGVTVAEASPILYIGSLIKVTLCRVSWRSLDPGERSRPNTGLPDGIWAIGLGHFAFNNRQNVPRRIFKPSSFQLHFLIYKNPVIAGF